MDGVILTPLKQITHPKGDIFHAMKVSDDGFIGLERLIFQLSIIIIILQESPQTHGQFWNLKFSLPLKEKALMVTPLSKPLWKKG